MEDDHLPEFRRELLQRPAQEPSLDLAPFDGIGLGRIVGRSVKVVLEGHGLRLPPLLAQPRITDIADDGEQPGSAVSAAEAVEGTMRPQAGVLHGILRIVWVAQQPAGKIIGGVQMGQHKLFERPRLRGHEGFHKGDNAGGARFIPALRRKIIFRGPWNNPGRRRVFNGKGAQRPIGDGRETHHP